MCFNVIITLICFKIATLATTAGIVIWMVSFYGLGFAAEMGYGKDFTLGLKIFLCLFPNVAINQALKVICTFEATEKGAKWGNIADSINAVDSLSLLYPFLMLFVSMLVNMLICLYVEAVLPKKYGVRKPFYFIFQVSKEDMLSLYGIKRYVIVMILLSFLHEHGHNSRRNGVLGVNQETKIVQ